MTAVADTTTPARMLITIRRGMAVSNPHSVAETAGLAHTLLGLPPEPAPVLGVSSVPPEFRSMVPPP
jgi:hypothetical protein